MKTEAMIRRAIKGRGVFELEGVFIKKVCRTISLSNFRVFARLGLLFGYF